MSIVTGYESVRERVADAARRAGRAPEDICIVAVSKTHPVSALEEALAAGATDLGENRAQELREKAAAIGPRARWHFIGHLQTNKVRHVAGVVSLIHSIDSLSVAEAVSRRARSQDVTQDVLIEVNVSGEPTKHGLDPSGALSLAQEVADLDGLRLRGLMTMPPWPSDPEDSRPYLARLAGLRDRLTVAQPAARELSMGMTRDFEVAIEEGATIVRVGEAIFGARPRA